MIGPHADIPCHGSTAGAVGTRPLCAFRPNRPQQPAGMRIEPAPSDPSAAPASPAATAAADPPDEPPGVRCGSHGLRVTPNVGDSVHGVIVISGHVRLADDHRSGRAQPADDLGVRRDRPAVRVAAVGGRLAGDVAVVLDRHRHAEQRPLVAALGAGVGLVGLGQRALGERHAVGVELRVEPRDALEVQLGELARRDLAAADQLGLAGGAGEGEVDGVHLRR